LGARPDIQLVSGSGFRAVPCIIIFFRLLSCFPTTSHQLIPPGKSYLLGKHHVLKFELREDRTSITLLLLVKLIKRVAEQVEETEPGALVSSLEHVMNMSNTMRKAWPSLTMRKQDFASK
jgi:hypothetical protein